MISRSLVDYYRCPSEYADFSVPATSSQEAGFFRFDGGVLCYGRCSSGPRSNSPDGHLYRALPDLHSNGAVALPFDPDEVVDNFRLEQYAAACRPDAGITGLGLISTLIYYKLRPWLPVSIRRHLQRLRLSGWWNTPFPRWPVDTTVDDLFRRLVALAVQRGGSPVPFIWFWPEGAPACVIMTHDVEAIAGYKFSPTLMDIDEEYGIRSSFQIVPEDRYEVSAAFLQQIRARGFEVNVHDLNHDGHLFRDRLTFDRRAEKIRDYARKFGSLGFRSGAMYRNPLWLESLGFQYDMSIPNAGQLDPQHGGCCTVMPFFIGETLEIPVTAVQDYSLFHILNRRSIDIWCTQLEIIMRTSGMGNFIVHPDYITESSQRDTYTSLLSFLKELRVEKGLWMPQPQDVNQWWRARHSMRLVKQNGQWKIEGPQSERARIAYAVLDHGQLCYKLQ
ncbi:MAG: hypothetical protein WA628_08890 [Terriglobales bacterium]